MKLQVILEPNEEGGFTVYVPSLPGCISEGSNREEALANIKEAIALYLEPIEDDILVAPNSQLLRTRRFFTVRSSSFLARPPCWWPTISPLSDLSI